MHFGKRWMGHISLGQSVFKTQGITSSMPNKNKINVNKRWWNSLYTNYIINFKMVWKITHFGGLQQEMEKEG